MVIVAEAEGWIAAADTLSDRVRVGHDGQTSFLEARWTGESLWIDPPGRPLDGPVHRSLERAIHRAREAADPATRREIDRIVSEVRAGVHAPSSDGEVVVTVERVSPLTLAVELYHPLAETAARLPSVSLALGDWWTSVFCEMPEGFDFGDRSSERCSRNGREGMVTTFVYATRPPWPPPDIGTGDEGPYGVLETTSAATDDEVKAAYLHQLKLNHPDRVAHLSAAIQRTAHDETLRIQRAYEEILRLRR